MIKKNINKIFNLFLITHLVVWVLIPSYSNINLPLDIIEALAWGTNLSWGWDKHPPLSVFFPEIFYQIFGSQDWVYYLLSQIFIIISFIYVFKLAKEFLKNELLALTSVLLLESIFFYNFTSPEFNVNVCQMPFWALTVYYAWQSFKKDKTKDWILFGIFAALGFLSKYLFIYLLISLDVFFIYYYFYKFKKFNYRSLIPLVVFILVIAPHLSWVIDNDYKTITYGLKRTSLDSESFLNHVYYPLKFLGKQIGILIPFFGLLLLVVSKFKIKSVKLDEKLIFVFLINFFPIFLMFLTSLILGANIRTMWMSPFYLFFGLFFIYIYKNKLVVNFFKKFIWIFSFLFVLSTVVYLYVSISKDNKRTDYPGREIAQLVQTRWDKNFKNDIQIIVGDEWFGGNLAYHLRSRPKWYNNLSPQLKDIKFDGGVIYTGNAEILKSICPGEFGSILKLGICMIGVR